MTPNFIDDDKYISLDQNKIISNTDEKILSHKLSEYFLPMYVENFLDEKTKKKFIKNVESQVRGSVEYKSWREYVVYTLGHYTCKVTGEINDQVSIDIHHHPFSLFSISEAIVNKKLETCEKICTFDISKIVLEMHYSDMIGYIPLCSTIHQKFHNGFISIPMEMVYGNWMRFYNDYSVYLSENTIECFNNRKDINKNNCGWSGEYIWLKGNLYT